MHRPLPAFALGPCKTKSRHIDAERRAVVRSPRRIPKVALVVTIEWLVATWCVGFTITNPKRETSNHFEERSYAEFATGLAMVSWIVFAMRLGGGSAAAVSSIPSSSGCLAGHLYLPAVGSHRVAQLPLVGQLGRGDQHADRARRKRRHDHPRGGTAHLLLLWVQSAPACRFGRRAHRSAGRTGDARARPLDMRPIAARPRRQAGVLARGQVHPSPCKEAEPM